MEPPTDSSDQSALDRIRAVEDEIRQSRWVEIGVVLDALTGQEIWRKLGLETSVGFTQREITIMQDRVLSHNHPVGWRYLQSDPRHMGTSFTPEDVELAIIANVAELRAVTPLLRFSLKRSVDGWPGSETVLADYDLIDSVLESRLANEIKNSSVDVRILAARQAHEIMSRLSSAYGLDYSLEVG